MPKRKQPAARDAPAAQEAAAAEPAAKLRRSPRQPQAAQPARPAARTARHASAAAAAAAGRAESDTDASGSSSSSSEESDASEPAPRRSAAAPRKQDSGSEGDWQVESEGSDEEEERGEEEADEDEGGEDEEEEAPARRGRRWRGVVKGTSGRFTAMVRMVLPGERYPKRVPLGQHPSQAAAARVYDRALVALRGPKAAAEAGLNYGLREYPGDRQLFGPDLHAFLLQLTQPEDAPEGGPGRRRRKKQKGRAVSEERKQTLQARLDKAQARGSPAALRQKRAEQPSRTQAQEAVGARRRRDPRWAPPLRSCGVCPACRQPWRTDLGGCLRLAAAKAAGHSEAAVVQMLAGDPAYLAAALEEHRQWREQQQERGDEESGSGSDQPARGPGRPRLDGAPAQRHTPVAEDASLKELDWLQLPGRSIAAAEKAVAAIKQPAVQGLKQQLGRQEAELLDELERERATSAAAPPPVGASTAPHAGAGLGEADRGLVDASSSLARAAPPADVAGMRQPDVAQLVQLAALCGAGGLGAPLTTDAEAAEELVGAAAEEQAFEQRWAELLLPQDGADSEFGELADPEARAAALAAHAAAAQQRELEGARRCTLCGGPWHAGVGLKGCPVAQMALALAKPQPDCPGCGHLEQPGCRQCLPGFSLHDKVKPLLARPPVRRAPWLDGVPPATRELMQAVQVLSQAAVADLDIPQAAWRCTPRALLAAGLLAEEAAKRELAARFPAAPAGAGPAAAQQQRQRQRQQVEPGGQL